MSERPTVTIKEATAICLVSRRTVYNWLRDDLVQYVRVPSGHIRIYRDCLQSFGNVEPTKETE